ncbi:hypothetical protein BY996DRAFT_6612395 [Phakopsora pachyrhizi]|nr:hypothetical protein BY996DRAFT_6453310 [Phakopsora pachyrhizi]KAI8461242.1 hypothetical protein BY996DRAFT_6612395 [Phakopsora pachyrhizi]
MSVRLDWLSEEMEKRYQPEDDKPKPLPCPAALMYDDDQMATKDSSDNQKRLRPNTDNDDSRSAQEQVENPSNSRRRMESGVNQSPTPPRRPAWVLSGLRVAMWQRRARGTSSESTKPGFSSALSTAVSNTALNIITTVIKASWELRELLITLLILMESSDYPKMK